MLRSLVRLAWTFCEEAASSSRLAFCPTGAVDMCLLCGLTETRRLPSGKLSLPHKWRAVIGLAWTFLPLTEAVEIPDMIRFKIPNVSERDRHVGPGKGIKANDMPVLYLFSCSSTPI